MRRLLAATALIVALSCSTAYASRVEVGAQPPTEPTKYIVLPDVIEVVDELHEKPQENWESLGKWKLTFYCPCKRCSGKWGRRTSSGATCEEGITVACATLPAGTVIKIDGYGERVVQDTGAGVRGRHLDVFMESHSECLKNGIQHREVWIKQ